MRAIYFPSVFRFHIWASCLTSLTFLPAANAERYFTQQFAVRDRNEQLEHSEVLREIHVSIASNEDLTEHRLTALQDVFQDTRRETLSADYYVDVSRDDFELFHTIEFTLDGKSTQKLPEVTYGRELSWPSEISGQYRVHRQSDDSSVISRAWSQPYDAVELGTRSHFFQLIGFETIEGREAASLGWQLGAPGISFVPTIPHEDVILDGGTFEVDFADELVSWFPGWSPGQSLGHGAGAVVLRERRPGDATLDDRFDSTDLVAVFQAGKYDSGRPASWADGDWNVDGLFDSGDLVLALDEGGYEQGTFGGGNAVPEPTSCVMLLAGMIGCTIVSRSRRG